MEKIAISLLDWRPVEAPTRPKRPNATYILQVFSLHPRLLTSHIQHHHSLVSLSEQDLGIGASRRPRTNNQNICLDDSARHCEKSDATAIVGLRGCEANLCRNLRRFCNSNSNTLRPTVNSDCGSGKYQSSAIGSTRNVR
jgi:hypothetical protein